MIKSILRFIIPAQMAVSGPPLGPTLGQAGIPAGEFCKRFNELSLVFKKGTLLRSQVIVMLDRTFKIEIKEVLLTKYLLDITNNNLGSKKGGFFVSSRKINPITNYMLFEVLMMYGLNYFFYHSLVGICKSIGILILNYKND